MTAYVVLRGNNSGIPSRCRLDQGMKNKMCLGFLLDMEGILF